MAEIIRKVPVYCYLWNGQGSQRKELEITSDNFISENDATITIKETYTDQDNCERKDEAVYQKTKLGFIQAENSWFHGHIKELINRHRQVIKMVQTLPE